MKFRREIRWEPRDGRMRVRFLLHGDLGATQFLMEFRYRPYGNPLLDRDGMAEGVDVGYHAVTNDTGYGTEMEQCDVLAQGHCWYDGSGLQGEELGKLFMAQGETVVWEWLEDRYRAWLMEEDDDPDDGMLAAGEQPGRTESATPKTDSRVASDGLDHPSDRPEAQVPAPAASVPDNGLSAGEAAVSPTVPAATPGGGSSQPSPELGLPAPAERPYRPDWKKGSKK